MNNHENLQSEDLPLTDELVATYLADNPDFFLRNPALLNSLRLQDNQRGAVSLVERQQQQLRQKVQALEEEITGLMSVANANEQLFRLYSDLYLKLIDSQNSVQLLDTLEQVTIELLSMSQLKLWLKPEFELSHNNIATNDCYGVMKNRLSKEDYYFGRLQQTEQQLIFSSVSEGSVVLVKLEHDGTELGFLAINSNDAEHFDPRMDTLLIGQFRKLVAKLLHQHLAG